MNDFFQTFVISRSTEVLIKTKFSVGIYVLYILNLRCRVVFVTIYIGELKYSAPPLLRRKSMINHIGYCLMLQCSVHAARCFTGGPRRSNESQCPMLTKSEKAVMTSSTMTTLTTTSKSTVVKNHLNSVTSSPHQKKLRFQLAKERKASTTLGIIMSAFTVCWLPFFVLALVRPFLNDANAIPAILSSVFLWLGYCNSLFNPIIYATLNRDFRKPFREILYLRCGNLNHMMREEFYQSQYGDPVNNYVIRSTDHEYGDRMENHGRESVDIATNPANESFL